MAVRRLKIELEIETSIPLRLLNKARSGIVVFFAPGQNTFLMGEHILPGTFHIRRGTAPAARAAKKCSPA